MKTENTVEKVQSSLSEAGMVILKMADEIASCEESIIMANQIEKALKNNNWTKAELARQTGISPSMVSKYLRGNENFTLLLKHKLQRVLGIKLGELAEENKILQQEIKALKTRITKLEKSNHALIGEVFHNGSSNSINMIEQAKQGGRTKRNTQQL
jgi:transcriptional regulator with XRE-family HTH domain